MWGESGIKCGIKLFHLLKRAEALSFFIKPFNNLI